MSRLRHMEATSTPALAIRFAVSFSIMGGCLFGSAGTFAWPEAWAYLAVQVISSSIMAVWLKKHDPELLEKRMSYFRPGLRRRDKLFALLFTIFSAPLLILPGLDSMRYSWSDVPITIEAVGIAGVICAMWLILRAMQENSFASPIVEIQKEHGHRVIDSGPYACVRHPMYGGFVVYIFALPLALGSWWTLPVALLISFTLQLRIGFEEKTLTDELDGYDDYMRKVRYRLIPGIW